MESKYWQKIKAHINQSLKNQIETFVNGKGRLKNKNVIDRGWLIVNSL